MKQRQIDQEVKKNFILYKGHTGWKVKTRLFGGLIVTFSALTLAEGTGVVNVHAATTADSSLVAPKSYGQPSVEPAPAAKESAQTPTTPVAPTPQPAVGSEPSDKSGQLPNEDLASNGDKSGQLTDGSQQQKPVAESASLTADDVTTAQESATEPNTKYPVLSQDKNNPTNIGIDTSEVNLDASQIADHFTATVENRNSSDADDDTKDNTHVATIGKDGFVALTSNDAHKVYTSPGDSTNVTGHQVAHVSFEHEIDFSHNFSLSGALGIGSKSEGAADSVGFIFAPGNPAEATRGGSGGMLGLQNLYNAFGLVYDQYDNSGYNSFNDPKSGYEFAPYIGWRTTDANGKLQPAADTDWMAASDAGLNKRQDNPLNDFTMDYNAESQTLTATLGKAKLVRKISDTSQGYSISVAASTGGSWNDYSARIDKFTYTPKTIPLTVNLVDSADDNALLTKTDASAIANIGDTVSVFSTQDAATRAIAKGLVDPNLVSVLPTDSAGNVYVVDGNQTPTSIGTAKQIDGSGVADDTYYTYTVTDGDSQKVTVPVRLAFTAKVTPIDAQTLKPIDGLQPVTVVAVAGEPTLVQIPGYTPTTVTLAAPKDGAKTADDTLPIDQGTTKTGTSSTTTKDTATPISHYYTTTGTTVDGQSVTTKATVGTGQSISTDLNQQPLVDAKGNAISSGGKTINSDDYYWSTTGNAGATDSTDEAKPQTSGSLLLPTETTLQYWENQATANQTKADDYNTQAQALYSKFMGITGLTQAQQADAKNLLQSVSDIYTSVSKTNGLAKTAFENAKTATAATDIYNNGQTGYAALEKVQNLLVSFDADLTDLKTNNTDAGKSLATFTSWSENYGDPIEIPANGFVNFGPDFWTNGVEKTADFSNSAYYTYSSTNTADGTPVTPKNVGKYFFNLTDAGRTYLKNLNPDNGEIGLYVSAMLTINPLATAATIKAATVEYGGENATSSTVGTLPAFVGSLGQADTDHAIDQSYFEVVDNDNGDAVVTDITQLKANGDYTIRYTQAAQDELVKDKNYTFTSFGTAKLTVTPREITVTAQNHGKTYNVSATKDPVLDLTSNSADGLVNGDSIGSLGVKLHRTTGDHAGAYDITEDIANSTLNSNYKIKVNKGIFTIARLPVTVQASKLSKIYGDDDPTLKLDDATLADGYKLTADDVKLSRATGESVGDYGISGSSVSTSNYNVTVMPGTFTITARPITLNVKAAGKTYGDKNPDFAAELDSETPLIGADEFSTLDLKLSRTGSENVGTYDKAITGTAEGNKNYAVTVVPGTFTITARPITLNVKATGKTYGDKNPDFAAELDSETPLIGADKFSSLGLNLSRTGSENVGTYDKDIIGTAEGNKNYAVTVVPGTFTITARPITLNVKAAEKTYGDKNPDFEAELDSETPLIGTDEFSSLGLNLSRTDNENVGTYDKDITGTAEGNKNYAVTVMPGTFTINKRAITVQIDNLSKVYDATASTDPALTWQIVSKQGLADGDTREKLNVDLNQQAGETVGHYAITGAFENANYDVHFIDGTLLINPRVVSVSVDSKEKVYGEADPALTCHLAGGSSLAADQSLADLVTLTRGAGEKVGDYTINGTSENKNYTFEVTPGTFTINKRAITIQVENQSKVYDATTTTDPALTWEIVSKQGLADGDTRKMLHVKLIRKTGENVGSHAITGTYGNSNYDVQFTDGDFSINSRVVSVIIDPQEKTYGEADPALTCHLADGSSLAADQSLANLVTLTRNTGKSVGEYTINGASKSNNYTFKVTPGTFTINKRAITVQIDNLSKVYDATTSTDQTLTWQIVSKQGLADGDVRKVLNVKLNQQSGGAVGYYAITGTFDNANYDVHFIDGTLLINPRVVSVLVDSKEKVYGEADPALTCQLVKESSLAAGQDLADLVTLTRDPGKDVGTYTIKGVSTNNNYTVVVTDGQLNITPRPLSVIVANQRKFYGDADPTNTWQVATGTRLPFKDMRSDLKVALSRTAGKTIGRYAITGTANDKNYVVTFTKADLLVDPRPVNVMIDNQQKVYGDANPKLTWKIDPNTPLTTSQQPADLNLQLSCGTAANVGIYTISGNTTNPNFAVTVTNGVLTVTPRPVTVTATNQSKTYGDADELLTLTDAKDVVVNGDTEAALGVTLTRETGEDTGEYAINGTAASQNYAVTVTPGTFIITKRKVTVTADSQLKTYGNADPTLTLTSASDQVLVNHDDESALGVTLTRVAGENVGSYVINGSVASRNYQGTVDSGALKIVKRVVTVTAADQSKVFGHADPTLTLLDPSEQLVRGDQESALGVKLTRESGEVVGTYEIIGTATNQNYTTVVLPGKFTIKPADAQVGLDNSHVIYGNMPVFMGRLSFLRMASNFALSDLEVINSQKQVVAPADLQAGDYTVQLTKQAQDKLAKKNPNYKFTTFSLGQLSVGKRPVTVRVASQEMFAGQQNPENRAELVKGSLVNDQSPLDLRYVEPNSQKVGTYAIDVVAGNPNYVVTVVPGQLKVLGKNVDSKGNVTITEKDPDGNVVQIDQQWADGRKTTYHYNPTTDERTVQEQKDGQIIDQQTITPDAAKVTLPDDDNTVSVVDLNPTTKQPTFDHYTTDKDVDKSGNVTTTTKNAKGDVVKVIKQWTDGSKTAFTYDPNTGNQTVTEQKDGQIVAEQTIAPNSGKATLPSGDGGETTVDVEQPGSTPTFDHYTTQKDVDKSGNVTTTTKDAKGAVVKVVKDWNDGSTTTYTADPNTGNRTVTEQKDGKVVAEQTIAPNSGKATLPSGDDGETTVDVGQPGSMPTFNHYTTKKDTDKSGNVTTITKDANGDVVKATKQWHDGSTTTYTYDPNTGNRTVTEQKDGKVVAEQTIAPNSAKATLPSGDDGETTVDAGQPGSTPTFGHYTTKKAVDKAGNVTVTTTDATGNVVKVIKQWTTDDSETTYTADPATGKRTISEQKDGQTVDQQTIAPGTTEVTLTDDAGGEMIAKFSSPASMPTFDHYTTQKTTDKAGNVTATTTDAAGNIVKVTKQWTDGSETTYTANPATGKRTISEQKNGKLVDQRTIAPGDAEVTLPDGAGGRTVIKFSQSATMPTFTHYPASYGGVPTSDTDKTVKITKQWPDGSEVIYTYEPITGKRIISELRNGHVIEQRTIAPGALLAILPDGMGGETIVKFDESGTVPTFTRQPAGETSERHVTSRKKPVKKVLKNVGTSRHQGLNGQRTTLKAQSGDTNRHAQSPAMASAGDARDAAVTGQMQSQRKSTKQQQTELPQTGQQDESFLTALGALLLSLLVTPFVRKRH
ncbi:hypothetical protein FC99_GL000753 [Levilactobacillus koreensis JCM 16448]|uniref:Gram-positive cocci surface proteins LPxTG domain-containing protein n=1 Tax=Levilactobacillus koreensis TaxID=637971 RepID=A0AAC8UUH7_9LACO|nr:MBG domain-containing protein [Levilactobacillus koreensis]AKP64127.1 hypothetical protein ABN16_03340 [Levilactobacillus koreensis]KRK87948.1 hypothetical protein FC99_GL000753 [Levilactobacillus koreensis JCM 16448]